MLSDVAAVLEVNEAGDVISLLDAALVDVTDVTDVANGSDDSSLLDDALVVTALKEVME